MITRIFGKNMKGLEFEQPLKRLNLFVGPNGSGKSARTYACLLAVQGYIAGVAKQNSEIYETFGTPGSPLFVGIERSDKTHLTRRFARDDKGAVSQNYLLDRRASTKDKFVQALAGLKILDLSAFMALSDQKKIDQVFALFPPGGDISEIDARIEQLKEKQSEYQGRLQSLNGTKTVQGTIARLKAARASIQIPAGTLAEITARIGDTEKALSEARKSLQDAKVERARVEAEEAAAKRAEEDRARIKAEARAEVANEAYTAEQEAKQTVEECDLVGEPDFLKPIPAAHKPPVSAPALFSHDAAQHPILSSEPAESIQAIIETMNRTGCGACAALLVAKRELRKHRKGAAA